MFAQCFQSHIIHLLSVPVFSFCHAAMFSLVLFPCLLLASCSGAKIKQVFFKVKANVLGIWHPLFMPIINYFNSMQKKNSHKLKGFQIV